MPAMTNRLAKETSPYLQQHAGNPVDWYPWSQEALERARREERPDLDQIYQTAHHMLSQRSGGWPLTMFLSPDGAPFFGGTYFPKSARHGLPGFPDLCERIAAVWGEKRAEITAQN